jgi:proteasome assembly chaperone (PAC2) family protein
VSDALRQHAEPELTDVDLILAFAGWNDAGEAATFALSHLHDELNEKAGAELLVDIDPQEFYDFTVCRPEIVVSPERGRHIRWPANEFRYGRLDASRHVVTCLGIEPHLHWARFIDSICEVVERVEARRIVMLGAYLADVVYSQPVQVTGFSSSAHDLERLDVQPSSYEGPTGIVGVLADRLERDGHDVVSLWAGLPHYINASPNPRGALALLEKLTECLGLGLDLGALDQATLEFEEKISKLVAADPELGEYVRQLKRREFAQ